MINLAYKKLIEHKSIALIGGAPEADERRAAAADIVIRCNVHPGVCNGRYIGGTVKFLPTVGLDFAWIDYRCLLSLDSWRPHGIRIFTFENLEYEGVSPRGEAFEWLNALNKQLRSVPLTGILAADHLLQYPIGSLYVTGFDFWIDEIETLRRYDPLGRITYWKHNHELRSQLRWLLHRAEVDRRVRLDPKIYVVANRIM